jgi:hypothetical protein
MKNVDIIDVMIAVHRGELKVVDQKGFFLLENTISGERVRLNESHGEWKFCPNCGEKVYGDRNG